MTDFPDAPIAPAEYLERWLPEAFADADVPDDVRGADVALGVLLEGDGGGEWVLRVKGGALDVSPGSRADTAFTFVQTVADWRGALWEGRGGAIGQGAAGLFRPGQVAAGGAAGMGGAPSLAVLEQLRALDGVIRMVVAGGEGGDWAVAFKLGPGEIPAEPTTTVTVTADDAVKLQTGELNPMEAFMAGRIRVAGDMALMLQMQAIQMQAAAGARKA